MKPRAKQIFWNAMLLAGATLLMRTVGVGFGVAVTRRAGAEAMGLFSLMGGVYGFSLTLATSGIHLGVTHIVVDAIGKHREDRIAPAMRRAVLYALLFGGAAAVLLVGFAERIGCVWLKDARTVTSLRLYGISLPLIAVSSALGGYFNAVRRVWKSALVQLQEQAVKIGLTMLLLTRTVAHDVERACIALVLGGTLAELGSFLLSLTLYLLDRRRHYPRTSNEGVREIGKQLMRITLPVAFTACLRSGLVTLEHILIPEGLRSSGKTHAQALVAYGCIQSLALPIILYPAAIISSFSGLLVPELAECHVRGSERRVRYIISRVWALSLLFSFGTAGLLICFSEELGALLYPGTDAGRYIRLPAPLIPIMYVDTATDAMMKGLGEHLFSMNINLADALISVLLVWLLTPRLGIAGYLITIYFSELFNTVLSIHHLLTLTDTRPRLFRWVWGPLLSIVGATCIGRLALPLLDPILPSPTLSLTVHCLLTLLLYLLLLLLCGSLGREELHWLASLVRGQTEEGQDHKKSLRNCRPASAACSVGCRSEKSATRECGFRSGSS